MKIKAWVPLDDKNRKILNISENHKFGRDAFLLGTFKEG